MVNVILNWELKSNACSSQWHTQLAVFARLSVKCPVLSLPLRKRVWLIQLATDCYSPVNAGVSLSLSAGVTRWQRRQWLMAQAWLAWLTRASPPLTTCTIHDKAATTAGTPRYFHSSVTHQRASHARLDAWKVLSAAAAVVATLALMPRRRTLHCINIPANSYGPIIC